MLTYPVGTEFRQREDGPIVVVRILAADAAG
jgi:hypothetical protein